MTESDGAQPGEERARDPAAAAGEAGRGQGGRGRGDPRASRGGARRGGAAAAQRRQLEDAQRRAQEAHARIAELDRELSFAIEAVVGISAR